MKPKIGIRPIIDGRTGIRETLEEKTMSMAREAAELISSNLRYPDGTPVECTIASTTIGGVAEAARCAEEFRAENVCGTISVTPCWCYGSETMDTDPLTAKAVWGFNGTERPGAVYLAAVLAAHAQKGLPAFSIYGKDVQDVTDTSVPDDVKEKIVRFARCAVAVGYIRGRSYLNIGSVSMGIMGSYCDDSFFRKYLGLRSEWVDMSEVHRRLELGIYDPKEFEKAICWAKEHCQEGEDRNLPEKGRTAAQKKLDWETAVKMTLILRDLLLGNPALAELGYYEESLGKNAVAGGFQGQRAWSDWMPNADFAEAILNSTFDWNGKREPVVLATENDTLNAVSMLFGKLLTGGASVFADVRTYWSPEAVFRVTGRMPEGLAAGGFIHLINSGSAALDATGASKENGQKTMKPWWGMTGADIDSCLKQTDWCPANLEYFRGGGYSSHFKTSAEMPVTMMRVNLIDGLGPALQIAEGYTVVLPDEIHDILDKRTDPTWPTTWFVPKLTGKGAFADVYSVMANWGANHGSFSYGHIGAELITLASMLRIPVSLHNVEAGRVYRPHAWSAFGTDYPEGADYRACAAYGPLYK